MKKISSKKMKIVCGSLGASILLVPTVAISAVACSSEKNPIIKPTITISVQPVNENMIINQKQNLPLLSVAATSNNENVKLNYQWYENSKDSVTDAVLIKNATNSSYTIEPSQATTLGTKYFFVKISGTINGIKLNPITSNTVTLTVDPAPVIDIATQPVNQVAYVNQSENLPSFNVVATPINNATFTYQWYSNTSNSTTGGTAIQGATKSSYQVTTADVGSSPTTKYFYVVVSGTINGVALTPLKSSAVSLSITATLPSTAQTVVMN